MGREQTNQTAKPQAGGGTEGLGAGLTDGAGGPGPAGGAATLEALSRFLAGGAVEAGAGQTGVVGWGQSGEDGIKDGRRHFLELILRSFALIFGFLHNTVLTSSVLIEPPLTSDATVWMRSQDCEC